MKTVPPRSPSRRSSPPPPPRMPHRSPGFRRGRSPERRRRVDSQSGAAGAGRMSPPRSRERREFRTSPRSQPPDFPGPRRSRSPIRESKRRSFSPKRKSPKRDRERREQDRDRSSRAPMSRKRSRSKSPPMTVGPPLREGVSRMGPYTGPPEGPPESRGYQGPEPYPSGEPAIEAEHPGRSMSSLERTARFQVSSRGSYEEERVERPTFRGPDEPGYDTKELKNISIDVSHRNVFHRQEQLPYDINDLKKIRVCTIGIRNVPVNKSQDLESRINPDDVKISRRPGEGIHPIFAREEIIEANQRSKYEQGASSYEHRSGPADDHQRIVLYENPPRTQTTGGQRFESPGRYSSSHAPSYFGEREHGGSSREYRERSRDYERGFDPRDKNRDEHFERRDDLRHDLELRRRDDSRYSSHGDNVRYEKGRDYREGDRGSDLRMRIHEKRSDRHDDRDMSHHHHMDRHDMERERDRRPMMQPSPPGDRRRGPMEGGYGHMGDGERKMRMGPGSHGGPSNRRNDHPDRFHQDSEFNQRPDRFHGPKPWDMNPEYVPKGRAYFEHDNRDEMRMPNRGRGSMGPRYIRGRGMNRGRIFRGGSRGFMGGRGTGRRGGYSPRFKPSSPHWEHDLFDKTSPDRGNNGFSK